MRRIAARAPRALAAPLLALAAAVALSACGDDEPAAAPAVLVPTPDGVTAPPTAPTPPPAADAADAPAEATPAARRRTRGQLTVHVTRPVRLRSSPDGRVVGGLTPRTEFDSPTVLPVLRERDGWLGVLTTALPNGRIGWISPNAALVPYRTRFSVVASLSRREVVVRRGRRVVLRFPIAVGSRSTPTPTGRFAVTDKLLTNDPGSVYGCCIVALSARQPHTPQGWGGGDRVAIHATNLPETIGTAASLGCMRAPAEAVRRAVRLVPLGTIVRVRA
ncbi:MAG TPA: L,D-transpeptidase [Conexibacter sp.]|nr:L,D-transpeptidase [Conexibacter sp.]